MGASKMNMSSSKRNPVNAPTQEVCAALSCDTTGVAPLLHSRATAEM